MASIQQLQLNEAGPISAATLPGIKRLTALEDLELSGCDLEPSCLLPVTTGLTRLCMEHVTLQPRQAQQGGTLGTSQLLLVLAQCTALRELTMEGILCDWPQQLALYSALTGSSDLQKLIHNSSIPGAAWAHVSPGGRQLPKLHMLTLLWDDGHPLTPFHSTAIARLASCCPAVQDLVFTPAADASLAPLQSLTALTHLYIGPVSPTVIRSNLTALTQLRSLIASVSLPAAGAGEDASHELQHLVPLTALTGLTELRSLLGRRACLLSSVAPAGSPPDVWVQLLEKCAADQAAQPALISSMLRQLQQQRQDTQEQVAAARAEAAAEAAQLCGRVQAAEGRVQALEGQLQEVLAALKQQQRQV